jgi:hypothetical protein
MPIGQSVFLHVWGQFVIPDDESSVLAWIPKREHRPRSWPTGRICGECPTVLSRYNPAKWCNHCGPALRRQRMDAAARRASEW